MKKTYLLSTKFVEKSFLFASPDKKTIDIEELRRELPGISLLSFYNDLLKPVKFYNNQLNYPDQLTIDFEELKQAGLTQDFNHIYSLPVDLKQNTAYMTFSYPFQVALNIPFNWYYWLVAYFEDVCALEGITAETLSDHVFIFVLHDQDLALKDWTIRIDLPQYIGELTADIRGLYEDTLFEKLISDHPDQISLTFCYAHNEGPVHQFIKNFDEKKETDFFKQLSAAVSGYGNAKKH